MNVWVEAARPRTLPAAIVPVLVGTAAAATPVGQLSPVRALLALGVALMLQIAVNYANDLFDGIAGIDTAERIGPRRVVAAGLVTPSAMRRALLVSLALAAVLGATLAVLVDLRLLLIGVAAVLATLGYSGGAQPYASRGLGEFSVFVFFGLVATVGSAYVQDERIGLVPVFAAIPVGLLAVGLLMINNVRDVGTDAATGKRTLAVRLGVRTYGHTFGWLLILTFVLVVPVALAASSAWLLVSLVALPLVAVVARRSREAARSEEVAARSRGYIAALEATSRLQLAFGLLLAAGLVLAGLDGA